MKTFYYGGPRHAAKTEVPESARQFGVEVILHHRGSYFMVDSPYSVDPAFEKYHYALKRLSWYEPNGDYCTTEVLMGKEPYDLEKVKRMAKRYKLTKSFYSKY